MPLIEFIFKCYLLDILVDTEPWSPLSISLLNRNLVTAGFNSLFTYFPVIEQELWVKHLW